MIEKKKICGDFDTQLMLRVKQGDIESYEILYLRYFSDISYFFANVGKVDGYSEDLAQKVFTCIWKNRESFRADSTFKTYIYGIAKKILKKHNRDLHRNAEIFKNMEISHVKTGLSEPEAAFHYAELLKNLEINKSKLSKKQRQAIDFLLDPDFTSETAAKMANCSNNTLRQRRFAARKLFKKLIRNI